MSFTFIHSFQSEWLKRKHTASSWFIVAGAFFMPVIVLFSFLISHRDASLVYHSKSLWPVIYHRNWAAMGMFLLPMILILCASLITNVEFRNNTWKQLHATPQPYAVIYFAKLAVLVLTLLQLFVLFNIGIYLSAVIPPLFFKDIPFPTAYPFRPFMRGSSLFFIDCLPVVAFQYLLSLKFKNFLVPIGVGFSLLVASLIAMNWRYGYIIPYIYTPLNFKENQNIIGPGAHTHYLALGYFALFTVVGYILYITRKEKG